MQLIHPELVGDLGDHLLAAELNLGICRPWDDRSGRVEWKSTALNFSDFVYVGSALPVEESMGSRRTRLPRWFGSWMIFRRDLQ